VPMSNAVEIDTNVLQLSQLRQRQFVLCNDCFWCCSTLSTRQFDIDICPNCKKSVSAMPIENNEAYTFNHTPSRGVELEFKSSR
jgi:hypothetical protein